MPTWSTNTIYDVKGKLNLKKEGSNIIFSITHTHKIICKARIS